MDSTLARLILGAASPIQPAGYRDASSKSDVCAIIALENGNQYLTRTRDKYLLCFLRLLGLHPVIDFFPMHRHVFWRADA
jgi:hypothetical protein